MKKVKIEFQALLYDWANWVATDFDGEIVQYENKPNIEDDYLYWNVDSGESETVCGSYENKDWRNSLTEVKS